MYQLIRLLLLISLLPTVIFSQQRQNMTYDVDLFAREHQSGHFQDVDTLDVLTYQAWNPARTVGAKLVLLTDLSQGLGARVLTFAIDTVIVEPDTIKFARFFFRGKKQVRQDFMMVRVSAGSYDRFDSKGRLIRREFVGDPELVFKDQRFRKDKGKIENELKNRKRKNKKSINLK